MGDTSLDYPPIHTGGYLLFLDYENHRD
jgi:hypothetical protein